MKELSDKVFAITGAASGIGRALSVELAGRGAHLALCDVDEIGLARTADLVSATTHTTTSIVDVADRDAMFNWAEQVVSEHGRANAIVNNAGVNLSHDAETQTIEDVEWVQGQAQHVSGTESPLSLADLAAKAGRTGGPISATHAENVRGAGAGFSTQLVDVDVDEETGQTKIVRFTTAQDAGKAIHPSYVEGQMQGGVVQGIGWALNEEYIHRADGTLDNPSFLDYRIPVASDLPMIDTIVVEVPNPNHPYGVRGVGEVGIVPPMAAIANAIDRATDCRMENLPMSPVAMLEAINERNAG